MFATLSDAISCVIVARLYAAFPYRGLPISRIVVGWEQCQCGLPRCRELSVLTPIWVPVGLN
jgi:hypothetical protein